MKQLSFVNLYKNFHGQSLLKGISYSFLDSGLYYILGDSGSGKSTLLNILSGCDDSYVGDVFYQGKPLKELTEDERSDLRLKHFGFIRQNYDLLELETVYENVVLPLVGLQVKKKLRKRKALEIIDFVGLKEKAYQRVNTLSGGEKQRVAIARALVTDPKVIFADEPTGALDKKNSDEINKILKEISKKHLVIVVSHDQESAEKYADEILHLQDGILNTRENVFANELGTKYVTFSVSKKENIKWSFLTWLKHAKNLFKAKKIRSGISVGIISFSLLSLGLSIYVQRDLQSELNNAFDEWNGVNGIVVERNGKNESTFGTILTPNEDEVQHLIENNPFIEDYGISYLCSYENYFKDVNEFYFDSFGKKVLIQSLSVRNINEYRWLDVLEEGTQIYPEKPKVLENEQIVLSLNYQNMINICASLHIQRTFESLGQYLKVKPLEIILETGNDSWGYGDSQLFSVVGILQEENQTIYHYRHDWNEYVFEDCMGFPSSLEDDSSLPWILRKNYYVLPRNGKEDFFLNARKNNLLDKYVFERDSYEFDQTHNEKNEVSKSERLYVFIADKQSIKHQTIIEISSKKNLDDYSVFGEGSYISYPGSMIAGFINPFFLSDSKEEIFTISESMSKSSKESVYSDVNLPVNVSMGHYLTKKNETLNISSDFSQIVEGEVPTKSNEICLSEKLFAKFNKSKTLYCAGVIANFEHENYIENDYRIGELKVVGIIKGNENSIYVSPYWTIDYWRDFLGMSSFSLEPKQVIFYCDKNESKKMMPILSNKYPSLKFTNPSLVIESSISNVIEYVEIVLYFATFLTLSTSFFLFISSTLLLALENKKEAMLLFELGVRRKNIVDCFGSHVLLTSLLSFGVSLSSLFSAEYTINKTLQSNFGNTSNYFRVDFMPALAMCVSILSGILLSMFFLNRWIMNSDFSRSNVLK